jgi:hypothetical protein
METMTPSALDELRDIHLPPPPFLASFLGDTEPWCIAAGLLALVTGVLWLAWRGWSRRWLRAALRELDRLADVHDQDGDTTRLALGLSRLLRHYALGRFPEAPIAGLSGPAWLEFLDAHGGGGEFSRGVGAVVEWRPYRKHGDIDEVALIALVRRWLRANPR